MLYANLCGKYQHYKNKKLYEVIGHAVHSETLEDIIVYKALYHCEQYGENQIWVRPMKMFFEHISHNGEMAPRFVRIE